MARGLAHTHRSPRRGWLIALLLAVGIPACGDPVETVVAHVCTPGGPATCDGSAKVVRCMDDGRGWAVTKVCGYGQACVEGACQSTNAPFGAKDAGAGEDATP